MALRRLVMIVTGSVLVAGSALLYGAINDEDASRAKLEQQLKEAIKQRVESAQRALSATQAAFEAETVTLDGLVYASNQLVVAELANTTKPEEEIAALVRYVERTKQTEKKVKLLYDIGTRGGEAKEYYTAKRERESAEIWLLRARIQAKQ